MDNGVPPMAGGLSYLHSATDFHKVAAIGVGLNLNQDIMGWSLNDLMLGVDLESILEVIIDVRNTNGEVVSVSNGPNKTECRFR